MIRSETKMSQSNLRLWLIAAESVPLKIINLMELWPDAETFIYFNNQMTRYYVYHQN